MNHRPRLPFVTAPVTRFAARCAIGLNVRDISRLLETNARGTVRLHRWCEACAGEAFVKRQLFGLWYWLGYDVWGNLRLFGNPIQRTPPNNTLPLRCPQDQPSSAAQDAQPCIVLLKPCRVRHSWQRTTHQHFCRLFVLVSTLCVTQNKEHGYNQLFFAHLISGMVTGLSAPAQARHP